MIDSTTTKNESGTHLGVNAWPGVPHHLGPDMTDRCDEPVDLSTFNEPVSSPSPAGRVDIPLSSQPTPVPASQKADLSFLSAADGNPA